MGRKNKTNKEKRGQTSKSLTNSSAAVQATDDAGTTLSSDVVAVLRSMVHPLFATMQRPVFDCGNAKATRYYFDAGVLQHLSDRISQQLDSASSGETCCVVIESAHPPDVLFAALSLSLFLTRTKLPALLKITSKQASAIDKFDETWNQWSAFSKKKVSLADLPTLPLCEGSYQWIRQSNTPWDRLQRLAEACSSMRFATSSLKCVQRLIYKTELKQDNGSSSRASGPVPEILLSDQPVLEEAAQVLQEDGKTKIAVVNAASAYHLGGGFLSGGRHALEEAMCMQTTLYCSLLRAAEIAKMLDLRDSKGRNIHIPEDGIVLSPGVSLFRTGSSQGYAVNKKLGVQRLAAVISVAMPNQNPQVRDSPIDFRKGDAYNELIRRKWCAVLEGADQVGAHVLIVPDVGCGVFQNHPTKIGVALGEALLCRQWKFKQLRLAGSLAFFNAVQSTIVPPSQPCRYPSCSQGYSVQRPLESKQREPQDESSGKSVQRPLETKQREPRGDDSRGSARAAKRTPEVDLESTINQALISSQQTKGNDGQAVGLFGAEGQRGTRTSDFLHINEQPSTSTEQGRLNNDRHDKVGRTCAKLPMPFMMAVKSVKSAVVNFTQTVSYSRRRGAARARNVRLLDTGDA